MIDFEDDASDNTSEDALKRVIAVANDMLARAKAVEAAELALKEASAAHRELERDVLPGLMQELGISSVTLEDGSVVAVAPDVDCYLSEERRAAGCKWLEDNGFEGLIKTALSVSLSRDRRAEVGELARKVQSVCDAPVEVKSGVHPQTLRSFIKERLEVGDLSPEAMEIFAVRPFDRAKVTAPKRGKSRVPSAEAARAIRFGHELAAEKRNPK